MACKLLFPRQPLASLASPGFVDEVSTQLAAHPQAAGRLWVEWVETSSRGDWHAAGEATQHWRRYGVHIGVEHAGGAPEQLARLRDLGLDYVKVDARHLRVHSAAIVVSSSAKLT